jgi:hypothetical protein
MHSTSNLNDEYLGSGSYLWRSIRKYGRENHHREVLEFLPDRISLREKEREVVNETMLNDPLCMNLHKGGADAPMSNFGSKRTEETKNRMSAIQQIVQKKPEVIEKRRQKLIGQKRSNEHREKMSKAWREWFSRNGNRFSPRHLENMSKAQFNRSPETEAKMTERKKGRKRSVETVEKMREGKLKTEDKKRRERYNFPLLQRDLKGNLVKRWETTYDLIKTHPEYNIHFILRSGKAYKFQWEKV